MEARLLLGSPICVLLYLQYSLMLKFLQFFLVVVFCKFLTVLLLVVTFKCFYPLLLDFLAQISLYHSFCFGDVIEINVVNENKNTVYFGCFWELSRCCSYFLLEETCCNKMANSKAHAMNLNLGKAPFLIHNSICFSLGNNCNFE